jgi:hypothetical protein
MEQSPSIYIDFLIIALRWLGDIFLPLLGLIYVTGKIIIKWCIRNAFSVDFDFWEVMSWFGVDLACFNLLLSAKCKTHIFLKEKYALTYESVVCWYVFLTACFLGSIFLYGLFGRRRSNHNNTTPLNDLWLTVWITVMWLIGFLPLFIIIDFISI